MSVLHVEVAVALPSRQEVVALELAPGTTVAQALAAAGVRERFPELDWDRVPLGIWSRPCTADRVLREGDRIEAYRPLAADPKEQRRDRARLRASPRSRNGP